MNYQKPAYQITNKLLKLIQNICQKIGKAQTLNVERFPREVRKSNRI